MKYLNRVLIALALSAAAFVPLSLAQENKPLDENIIKQIEVALPAKPRVQPQKPRKLLVFTLCKGFVHSSIPYGTHALLKMGEVTGAFAATQSDDPAVFAADNIKLYDAVCMLNTTGELFEDPVLRESLLNFVKSGKGIVGIHAATDCFYTWADYGEMMGGYFNHHPWGAGTTVVLKLDDPSHPLNQAFAAYNFTIKDEIYQYKAPYSRANLRILTGLDTEKTDMKREHIERTDGDFAVSWCRVYGQGRVFYSNLGHNESTYYNTPVLQQYLDGLQFAFGDLSADATPSAALSEEFKKKSREDFDKRSLKSVVSAVAAFDYGMSPDAPVQLSEWVVASHGDVVRQREIAAALDEAIGGTTTATGLDLLSKELYLIATEADVPAIAPLLLKAETSDNARYALEKIPGDAATRALTEALPKLDGKAKVGVINSLGVRKDKTALADLGLCVEDKDASVVAASIWAIAQIGGKELPASLQQIIQKMDPAKQDIATSELLLSMAATANADGGGGDQLYRLILDEFPAGSPARDAAFVGLVKASGNKAPELLVESLKDTSKYPADVAGTLLREVKTPNATKVFCDAQKTLPAESRAILLLALGDRGDPAAFPAVAHAAVFAQETSVRTAAYSALGQIGNESIVSVLMKAAANGDALERDAAMGSLEKLDGQGIEKAILSQFGHPQDPGIRAAAIRVATARRIDAAAPLLLEAASDVDPSVASEAFSGLSTIAGPDVLPGMVDLLLNSSNDTAREAAMSAIVKVAAKKDSDEAGAVLAALEANKADSMKTVTLLNTLGRIGDNGGLDSLRVASASTDKAVSDAAIRALCNWTTPVVLDDLVKIAGDADESRHALALRGSARLLNEPSDRGTKVTLQYYEKIIALAKGPDEIKLILGGLGTVRDPQVVAMVEPYLNDPATKAEAELVINKLKEVGLSVKASNNDPEAGKAIDGDLNTRWTTGTSMSKGMWFVVDLGWEKSITKLVLDATPSSGDYPRGYEVYVTADDTHWGEPLVEGEGKTAKIEIPIPNKNARFLKIVQTGSHNLWWSIHELTVETN
jgi:type 1 glutamine amidotransferase/HEAT repeat protein